MSEKIEHVPLYESLEDSEIMDSIFIDIRKSSINSEEDFDAVKDHLNGLGWSYDVSDYLYWSDPDTDEQWYAYHTKVKQEDRDDIIDTLSDFFADWSIEIEEL